MEYWIWLTLLKGIGPITQKKLLAHFKTPKRIYDAAAEELRLIPGMGASLVQAMRLARSLDGSFLVLEALQKKNIKLLVYDEPTYPELAKALPEAPLVLYYAGRIGHTGRGIGIVGARRCSPYGKQVAIEAATFLAQQGIPVISGLAKGIDSYAHTACLSAGGYTIAFLGNGVDVVYPREHRELQAAIIENGAVISTYSPGTTPRPQYFLQRNALISSWSQKLLVAEAGVRSGALSTALYAKKLNRPILAPPHELYGSSGQGTNQLLENGALLYLHPEQLKDCQTAAGARVATNKTATDPTRQMPDTTLTADQAKLLAVLVDAEKTIQQLEAQTGINQVRLLEQLAILEVEGRVERGQNGCYRCCH